MESPNGPTLWPVRLLPEISQEMIRRRNFPEQSRKRRYVNESDQRPAASAGYRCGYA